jgi:hypothetical protein
MMFRFAIAVALLAVPAAALAQSPRYQDGGGRTWDAIRSETGLVLATRGATIHLSRDCKAVSARYGEGSWQWTNGGFTVRFATQEIGFPRQEVDVGQGQACRG